MELTNYGLPLLIWLSKMTFCDLKMKFTFYNNKIRWLKKFPVFCENFYDLIKFKGYNRLLKNPETMYLVDRFISRWLRIPVIPLFWSWGSSFMRRWFQFPVYRETWLLEVFFSWPKKLNLVYLYSCEDYWILRLILRLGQLILLWLNFFMSYSAKGIQNFKS